VVADFENVPDRAKSMAKRYEASQPA